MKETKITLIHGDCLIELPKIQSESIDLVCVDIPYNLGKAFNTKLKWDKFGEYYIEWIGKGFKESERVLKSTGSFYFFHNDFSIMSEIQQWVNKNTSFNFRQFIVWNKRFKGCRNKGYLDGFVMVGGRRNYQKMAEYICYYIKQPDYFPTPFSKIIQEQMQEWGVNQKDLAQLELSKKGNLTGWVTNKLNGSQLPTRSQWMKICEFFHLDTLSGYDYDFLEEQYHKGKFTFNNQKTHHSVWEYDIVEKIYHPTQKPVVLLENILLHSSNEGDVVLDYCMGSGSIGIACLRQHRSFIGIEKEKEYYEIATQRMVGGIEKE